METYWSQAAGLLAGADFPAAQKKLLHDVADITEGAYGEFDHMFWRLPDGVVFLCHGEQTESGWRLFVQLARYLSQNAMPVPLDSPDNRDFAPAEAFGR